MNYKTRKRLKDADLILGLADKITKIGWRVGLFAVLVALPYVQSVMSRPLPPFAPASLVVAGASTTNSTLR